MEHTALSSSSFGSKLLALKVRTVRKGTLGETDTESELAAGLVENVSETVELAAELE